MKLNKWLLVVLVALPFTCHAGGPNCTGTTVVSSPGLHYNASTSDCVISVEKSISEQTFVHLPRNAQVGDEFTVQDNSPYSLDECDSYTDPDTEELITYCWPAGVQIESLDSPNVTVDGSNVVYLAGYYYPSNPKRQRVKLVFDGSDWNATYSQF